MSGTPTPRSAAERLEHLLRQEASLREVIETISSDLDLRSLLTQIAESACHLLEAENGAIGLVDDDRQVVRIEATYRMPEDELGSETAYGQGLSGKVMATGKPVIFRSYGDIEDATRSDLHDNAVIGVPIFWRDRLIGTFGLGSAPPRQFSEEDADVLGRFAKHAAIAIENARLFDHAQAALGEMQLLYETSARLGVALHPDEIVSAYLEQVATKGKYACTIIEYEFSPDGERESVLVKGRWDRREGTIVGNWRFPHAKDDLDDVLDRGDPVLIRDVETDPRVTETLRDMQRQDGHPSLAMIPLISSGRRIGLVILTANAIHDWSEAELRPYLATAAYLAIALEHRHEQMNLFQAERQVAVLQDRQRLAHELHDSVTQLLTGINFIAQATPAAIRRDPAEGDRRLDQLAELSQRALAEMRALLAELAPREHRTAAEQIRDDEPVVDMIRMHLDSLESVSPKLTFTATNYRPQLPAVEHALFRIAQESVNNALKYAVATEITVILESSQQEVLLRISDDGQGLTESAVASAHRTDSSGLGIPGMRRRASDLGGSLRIFVRPGQGTLVEVRLPIGPSRSD